MITARVLGLAAAGPEPSGRAALRAERVRQLAVVDDRLARARGLYGEAQAGDGDVVEAGRLVRELEAQHADLTGTLRVLDEQDAADRRAIAKAQQDAVRAAAEASLRRAVEALPAAEVAFLDAVEKLVARAAEGVADGAALGEARRQLDEAYTRAGRVPTAVGPAGPLRTWRAAGDDTVGELLRQRSAAHGRLWTASGEGWFAACRALADAGEDPHTQDRLVEVRRTSAAVNEGKRQLDAESFTRSARAREADATTVYGRPPVGERSPFAEAGLGL